MDLRLREELRESSAADEPRQPDEPRECKRAGEPEATRNPEIPNRRLDTRFIQFPVPPLGPLGGLRNGDDAGRRS